MGAYDLVPYAGGADEAQVSRALTRLSGADARVLISVGRPGRKLAFEIFHDVPEDELRPPILRWEERFEAIREPEARKRAERERLAAEARRRTQFVKRIAAIITVVASALTIWAWVERNRADQQLAEAKAGLFWSQLGFRPDSLQEHELDTLWNLVLGGRCATDLLGSAQREPNLQVWPPARADRPGCHRDARPRPRYY